MYRCTGVKVQNNILHHSQGATVGNVYIAVYHGIRSIEIYIYIYSTYSHSIYIPADRALQEGWSSHSKPGLT